MMMENKIIWVYVIFQLRNLSFDLQYIRFQHRFMKNYVQQANETSDSQPYSLYAFPFMNLYDTDGLIHSFNIKSSNYSFKNQYQNITEDGQFTQRISRNILIGCKTPSKQIEQKGYLKQSLQEKRENMRKQKKIPAQKQSRNVVSNILRIFLKNILQIKTYSLLIQKTIAAINVTITERDFYNWLESFSINYKNYIQHSQIKRLFLAPDSKHYQTILAILMRNYLKDNAVGHCLTSKKIVLKSLKMHLKGLRELQQRYVKCKISL